MGSYYEEKLSGERLRQCYELAPPRIRRYLDAEIAFVADQVRGATRVLELGCGYGRVLREIASGASHVVGCDISQSSLALARSFLRPHGGTVLVRADAARLPFRTGSFDAVLCVQNGVSAFDTDRPQLASEAARVTRAGGRILFSSYAPGIWNERLNWFRAQARAGLLGPIDEDKTGDGTIVCTDGFRAVTVDGAEFEHLFAGLGRSVEIREVDESSLFCIVVR